jgi:hypothetical protein
MSVLSRFLLLLLALFVSPAYAQPEPYDIGSVHESTFKIYLVNSQKVLYEIPVPKGRWHLISKELVRNTVGAPIQRLAFADIIDRSVNRYISLAIHVNEDPARRWTDEPCSNNAIFKDDFGKRFWEKKCLRVNLVSFFTNTENVLRRDGIEYLKKNGISWGINPITMHYDQFGEQGKYFALQFGVFPERFGFDNPEKLALSQSPWHMSVLNQDPTKRKFVDEFIAWAKTYGKALESAYFNQTVTGEIAQFIPTPGDPKILANAQGKSSASEKSAPVVAPIVAPIASPQKDEDEIKRLNAENAKLKEQVQAKPLVATTSGHRRALIIGNENYKFVAKLRNAKEDAKALADSLARFGYVVTLRTDLTEKDMKSVLRIFKGQVNPGDEVAIFYAGHGVQLGAANYLLPIDVAGDNEDQVKDEAIPLQRILDDMSERKAKFTLAMLDACRDNPFKGIGRGVGGGTRGLAPTSAATGQMVVFSAGTGQQALDRLGPDDRNKNGVFTRVFLKEIQNTSLSIDQMVRKVRAEVVNLAKSVGHEQVPAIYDQVVGDFYFSK